LGGRPFLGFFASGWCSEVSRGCAERDSITDWASDSVSVLPEPRVGLLLGSSMGTPFAGPPLEPVVSSGRFFGGRPRRGVAFGGAFSISELRFSGIASIEGRDFLDGFRENWNPSSSSYCTVVDGLNICPMRSHPNLLFKADCLPGFRFPSLVISSSPCLLALNRVVLRSVVPLDAPADCDCVLGAAIAIVPSGSRRFVVVVVVARTAIVMSGGGARGVLLVADEPGFEEETPLFHVG
jgi:hypothetical protein